jgi:hypothetical protein
LTRPLVAVGELALVDDEAGVELARLISGMILSKGTVTVSTSGLKSLSAR